MEPKDKIIENGRVLRIRPSKNLVEESDDFEGDSRRRKRAPSQRRERQSKRKRKAKGEESHEISKGSQSSETESLTWTEKYKPSANVPFIGNSEAMKELRSWLSEWKANPANRCQALQSSDSEASVESGLSNCMLLCGPPGSGKTSAVYYLAHELGYKVIEVNASSERPGKKILAQLQEATQSHHVEGAKAMQGFQNLFANHLKPSNNRAAEVDDPEKAKVPETKRAASATQNARNKRVGKVKAAVEGSCALTHYFTPKVKEKVEEEVSVIEEIKKESPKSTLLDYFSSGSKKERKEASSKKVSAENGVKGKVSVGSVADADKVEVVDVDGTADVVVINDVAKTKPVVATEKKARQKRASVLGEKQRKEAKSQRKPSIVSKDILASSTDEQPGLTYSSLTLILFDDVDIIFQQDDGFWNAVENILHVTKKPVLFTATRDTEHVRSNLPSHCPLIELTRPNVNETRCFLEGILKREGSSVPLTKVLDFLVQYYHCDLRQCLLQLQFETAASRESKNERTRDFPRQLSLTNVSHDQLRKVLSESSTEELSELQSGFGCLGLNLVYLALQDVLPLPVVELEAKPVVFREKYCSEEKSSNTTLNLSWLADTSTEEEGVEGSEQEVEKPQPANMAKKPASLVSKSLQELSDLFGTLSTADMIRGASWKALNYFQNLQPSERMYAYCDGKALGGDETPRAAVAREWLETLACLESGSVKGAASQMTQHLSDAGEMPELSSLVGHGIPQLSNLEGMTTRERCLRRDIRASLQSVTLSGHGAVAAVLPDYASALHQICVFEQERRVKSLNRGKRFLHYLNSSNVFLSSKAMDTLCNQWLSV